MSSIVFAQSTHQSIEHIRFNFEESYYKANFEKSIQIGNDLDTDDYNDTLRLYGMVLSSKAYYCNGNIDSARIKRIEIEEFSNNYSRLLYHPLTYDEYESSTDLMLHNCRHKQSCFCQLLEPNENINAILEEELNRSFIDVYVKIRNSAAPRDFMQITTKAQIDKLDEKVLYKLEPPSPDLVYKSAKEKLNENPNYEDFFQAREFEDTWAKYNRLRWFERTKDNEMSFIDPHQGKLGDYCVLLSKLPKIRNLKFMYRLIIDEKYKYSFNVEMLKKDNYVFGIYWDEEWDLTQYRDEKRVILYFPDSYLSMESDPPFKLDGELINNLEDDEQYIFTNVYEKFDEDLWNVTDFDYSYGKPDSLLIIEYMVDNEDGNKPIDLTLTDKYEGYEKEIGKKKWSKIILTICFGGSILLLIL